MDVAKMGCLQQKIAWKFFFLQQFFVLNMIPWNLGFSYWAATTFAHKKWRPEEKDFRTQVGQHILYLINTYLCEK